MAQGSGSYYEDYMRSSALFKHCGSGSSGSGSGSDPALGARNAKKLLTDRGAYISFLEVQLERVSAACLTTQTFEARLAALEGTQTASNDKLGSLSKVLRLNQEFIEQNNAQAREAAASAAEKVDAWLDKLSTELQAQDARTTALEQRLRKCDEVLQALVDAAREDRDRASSDVDELRALLFAYDARLEDMTQRQSGADGQIDELRGIATTGLRKELGLMRSSLSEKTLQMEQTLSDTRSDLEKLVAGVQDVVDASVARSCDGTSRQLSDLRQQVRDHQREHERETAEVKGVLKKCLDTQHMLSATVVAIQSEVDSALQIGRSTSESNVTAVLAAVDELRENQEVLRNALRILEACTKDAQELTRTSVQALARQLESTDEAMEKLAHESFDRVDEMRQKVVEALDQVERQVKADTHTVSNRAIAAVQSELGAHSTQLTSFSNTMEKRIGSIERDLVSLQSHLSIAAGRAANTQRAEPACGVHYAIIQVMVGAVLTGCVLAASLATVESAPTTWNSVLLQPAHPRWSDTHLRPRGVDESYYLERIQELERQLHQRAQEEEERRLILQRSTPSRASSSSSSAASGSYSRSELLDSNCHQGSSKSCSVRSESVSASGSGRPSTKSSATTSPATGVRKKKTKKSELETDRTRLAARTSSRAQAPSLLTRGQGLKPRSK